MYRRGLRPRVPEIFNPRRAHRHAPLHTSTGARLQRRDSRLYFTSSTFWV